LFCANLRIAVFGACHARNRGSNRQPFFSALTLEDGFILVAAFDIIRFLALGDRIPDCSSVGKAEGWDRKVRAGSAK